MKVSAHITKSKVILLTGAGASMPLDLPDTRSFVGGLFSSTPIRELESRDQTAADLIDQLRQLASAEPQLDVEVFVTNLAKRIDGLSNLLIDAMFTTLISINLGEEIRRAFRAGLVHGSDGRGLYVGSELDRTDSTMAIEQLKHYQRTLGNVQDAIYDQVVATYSRLPAGRAEELYKPTLVDFPKWLQDIPGQGRTLPIFTTNYDMAVESAATGLDVRVHDSFRSRPVGSLWERKVLADYQEDPTKSNIVLVKLHGSVDWGAQYQDGKLTALQKMLPGLPRNPGGVYRHELLYPTLGTKDVRIEPYRTNYDCLRQCLLSANLLVAIGSSFRDPELNEEIRRGLEDNPQLHLLAVSPGADAQQLAALIQADESANRIAALAGKFGDESLTPLNEHLMSRIREFARIACGVNQSASSYHFGATFPFPIQPNSIPLNRFGSPRHRLS